MFLKSCTLFPRHAPGLGIVQEAIEQAALTHSSTMHCVKSPGFLGNSPNMVVYLYGPSQAEDRPSAAATGAAAPAAAPSKVTQKKITLQADTLFDFDKSNLKSEGVATLNKLAQDIKKMKLEVVIIVGYTDSVGTDAYNIALGQRRANAVKAFLTNDGGVEATRIYTESKGKADPKAANQLMRETLDKL